MLDDRLVNELLEKLNKLRDERIDRLAEERSDLNNLIADMMNGLETLFIIVNARVAEETKPQANRAVFVSNSNPNKPKML